MSTLKESVIGFLSTQGYALELETEKIFAENSFETMPSLHYLDPEEHKYRETDLIAHKTSSIGNFAFNLTYVIECKNTPERPWIVIKKQSDVREEEAILSFFGTSNSSYILKELMTKKRSINNLDLIRFNENEAIGCNVLIMSKNNNHNDAYAAIVTLRKACEYLVKKSNESTVSFSNVYIPIIVINAPLFNCQLNENGEIQVNESSREIILEARAFETPLIRTYIIVTKDHLPEFVKNLSVLSNDILSSLDDSIKKTAREKPSNSKKSKYSVH